MNKYADLISNIIMSVILCLIIVNYVFTSKALRSIAVKFKLRKSGFAWVPVASDFILGNIVEAVADKETEEKGWKKTLCMASVATSGIMLFTFVVFTIAISEARHVLFIREVSMVFGAFILMMLLAALVFFIVRCIAAIACTYKIFRYTAPHKAKKYLALSIFIPLAKAFILNNCKNKLYEDSESSDENIQDSTNFAGKDDLL